MTTTPRIHDEIGLPRQAGGDPGVVAEPNPVGVTLARNARRVIDHAHARPPGRLENAGVEAVARNVVRIGGLRLANVVEAEAVFAGKGRPEAHALFREDATHGRDESRAAGILARTNRVR